MTISRDTFDRLKNYVSVRLQEGVPLVDADWNEKDDIRRFEVQSFLKWFVGDGVPLGNDGFKISTVEHEAKPKENEFLIHPGHCFVQGWDVFNEYTYPVQYSQQHLSDDTIADELHVPRLDTKKVFMDAGIYTLYLDIWEREVTAGDSTIDPENNVQNYIYDTNLTNENIGLATCSRIKREWVVRVIKGENIPDIPLKPEVGWDHLYYPLARIAYNPNYPIIRQKDITDLRQTGLKIGSYNDTKQITSDAFGEDYNLDGDGAPNLEVSLRESINAILRGDLPASAPIPVSNSRGVNINPRAVEDRNGNIGIFWISYQDGFSGIYYKIWNANQGQWNNAEILLTSVGENYDFKAITDKNNNIWIFWCSSRGNTNGVYCQRLKDLDAEWSHEEKVMESEEAIRQLHTVATDNGDIWMFCRSGGSGLGVSYNQRDYSTKKWTGQKDLFSTDSTINFLDAVTDGAGDIWLFFLENSNTISYRRRKYGTGTWDGGIFETNEEVSIRNLNSIKDKNGDLWMFWDSSRRTDDGEMIKIYFSKINHSNQSLDSIKELPATTYLNFQPAAIKGERGDIWMFWLSASEADIKGGSQEENILVDVWCRKLSGTSLSWGGNYKVFENVNILDDGGFLEAIENSENLWVFSIVRSNNDFNIWTRKIILQI